jgi:hypothetical protein
LPTTAAGTSGVDEADPAVIRCGVSGIGEGTIHDGVRREGRVDANDELD